jgi:Phytoene dehydrogenase and related proteins
MFDFAVVGAGIGGSVVSSILNHLGYNVVLFERLDYLCGCAGTFKEKVITSTQGQLLSLD